MPPLGLSVGQLFQSLFIFTWPWVELWFQWSMNELRRLYYSLLWAVALPLYVLLPAAALGAVGFKWKLAWIELGMAVTTPLLICLALRSAAIGAQLTTLLGLSTGTIAPGDASDTVPQWFATLLLSGGRAFIDKYIRGVAILLASEYAVMFLTIWLPFHRSPLFAILFVFAAIGLVAFAIWQGGGDKWPKIVQATTILTLLVSTVALFVPGPVEEASEMLSGRGVVLTPDELREQEAKAGTWRLCWPGSSECAPVELLTMRPDEIAFRATYPSNAQTYRCELTGGICRWERKMYNDPGKNGGGAAHVTKVTDELFLVQGQDTETKRWAPQILRLVRIR